MLRKLFLGNDKNLKKKIYIWTILSGLFYSASSTVMLMVTTNVLGGAGGDDFSLGLMIGQQLITIGYFYIRNYQVSDVKQMYSFGDYFTSRVITCSIMMIAAFIWIFFGGYEKRESLVILFVCIYKMIEALSDVFEGLYHQRGRYDLASKGVVLKNIVTIAAYMVALIITKDIIISTAVLAISSVVMFLIFDSAVVGVFDKVKLVLDGKKQVSLHLACLPLFINQFLITYINNSARYAIEALNQSTMLTIYNIIFMPAFVINLFSGFILKPLITTMAKLNEEKNYKGLRKILNKQKVWILLLTVVCVIGAYLLGTQVLSLLYRIDISAYRLELCIILVGGGFCALYNAYCYAIVIIRKQYSMLISCVTTALLAAVFIPILVKAFGILGASVGYMVLMMIMTLLYIILFEIFLTKMEKEEKSV